MQTDFLSTENIPLSEVVHPMLGEHRVRLFVKRDDLIHPFISGNKWRKLKYNIEEMKCRQKGGMLTFGGAYSNHILAAAAAGNKSGFKTIGIIRGEEPLERNPVLKKAEELGMQLHFISREEYRQKNTSEFLWELQKNFPDFYIVPEGGANQFGVKGCKEIVPEINIAYTHICCCCGTGATLAGIALSLPPEKKAIGFCVHKGSEAVEADILHWTPGADNFTLINDYHFGGFAKTTEELKTFAQKFSTEIQIPIELVYTAKMFYGIFDLVSKNFFKPGSTLIAIHTGGIHNYL
jgi:1-aminocyclopropane-1-carboxylate deaminase